MPTTFVEVTPEEADRLLAAGLLWSKFLDRPWRHEFVPKSVYIPPSGWGTNWKFAIQVEE